MTIPSIFWGVELSEGSWWACNLHPRTVMNQLDSKCWKPSICHRCSKLWKMFTFSFFSKKDISMASRPLNRIGIFTRKLSHVNLMWWKGRIFIQCIEAEDSCPLWIRLRRPWITFQPVINSFGNLAWCCQIFGRQALMTRAFLPLLNWLHCCCDPHHHC